jgi:hypothetical protein
MADLRGIWEIVWGDSADERSPAGERLFVEELTRLGVPSGFGGEVVVAMELLEGS